MSVEELLKAHKYEVLPSGSQDRTRLIVCRKHILTDTFHWMRNGADLSQPLNTVFVGEPAVDDGGPLREFLYKVVAAAVRNESLFCGPVNSRVPRHNLPELEKQSFYYIGAIIALSLVHGGPAPQCFSQAVADYILYGVKKVNANVIDIPEKEMRDKISKVSF